MIDCNLDFAKHFLERKRHCVSFEEMCDVCRYNNECLNEVDMANKTVEVFRWLIAEVERLQNVINESEQRKLFDNNTD